jgi:hypothetical protein
MATLTMRLFGNCAARSSIRPMLGVSILSVTLLRDPLLGVSLLGVSLLGVSLLGGPLLKSQILRGPALGSPPRAYDHGSIRGRLLTRLTSSLHNLPCRPRTLDRETCRRR